MPKSQIDPKRWEEIKVPDVQLAPWNYKQADAEMARALENSLKRNGQIININVRELSGGGYEVIDGNHRLEAAIALGWKTIYAYNHGGISEVDAKRIAIELNEQRFPNDKGKMESIISELSQSFDLPDLSLTMPFIVPIGTEQLTETKEEIRAFRKVHVLVSFPPDTMATAGPLLEQLKAIPGVEYEQSAN